MLANCWKALTRRTVVSGMQSQGSTKSVGLVGKIKFQGAGQSKTRRKKTEGLSAEADRARLDPVGCQRCMAGGRN
jgi:hypothetical protein